MKMLQHKGNVHLPAACRKTAAMLFCAAGQDLEREPGFGCGEERGKDRCGKQARGVSEPWRNPAVTYSGLLSSKTGCKNFFRLYEELEAQGVSCHKYSTVHKCQQTGFQVAVRSFL